MTRKAFTLIELLVVVAVLALLASIVFSNLGGAREGARISNALAFQSQTHSLLGSDLVGWWNFNEGDARDISGYNNHGTVVGATHVDGVPGTGGSALSFDGVGDYVDLSGKGLNHPNTYNGSATVSIWVKPFRHSNGFARYIAGFHYWTINSTGRLQNMVNKPSQGVNYWLYGSSVIPVNEWSHVVYKIKDNVAVEYYVNGVLDARHESEHLAIISYSASSAVGATFNSFFEGLLDDVRIYSRALTAQEVQTLYAQTKDKYLVQDR